jgi:competence ComEA-like helix-hairpin-helix protein
MLTRLLTAALSLCLLAAPHSLAKKKPPTQPVNLNTAGSTQLQLVPGIGPAAADKILQMRKSYGAFKSVNDLLAIRGIGPQRLEKMRKYLTVARPVAANAAKPASCGGSAKQKARPPTKSAALPRTQTSAPAATQAEAETEEP